MHQVSLSIRGGEFWWSPGIPERFRITIHYGLDSKEGVANATTVLFGETTMGNTIE